MPSVGRIKKISVFGIAAATLAGTASFALAQGAPDTAKPEFAVGGYSSPAAGVKTLDIPGTDSGSGLRYAEAWLEGGPKVRDAFTGDAGTPANCPDPLSSPEGPVTLPPDNDCLHVGRADPKINTADVLDNPNQVLTVRVVDWAGNESVTTMPVHVLNHVDLGTNTQTLSIGTSGIAENPGGGNPPGSGGVQGAQSQSCRSPRLSFSLDQKPMRVSRGVPVLQYAKRYRFEGRLTCVVNGKRRSAPKRTRIDIFNRIGKRTYEKRGTTVSSNGRLRIILAYKSSRTLVFRYTNAERQRSQVSIRIKVERKKKSR